MQSHLLDGDGLNVELFKLLGRVSKTSVATEQLPFRIPDTVVYSSCASFWYYFDETAGAVSKRPAKALEKQTIFDSFSKKLKGDRGEIVAIFAHTRPTSAQTTSPLQIDYFTVADLRHFLFGPRKERFGLLQKHIEGKNDHAETVQVVYSPSMMFAVRRQNRNKQLDRTLPTTLRHCTFDGPSYQCTEYFSVAHTQQQLFDMCQSFVDFFATVEPSFVVKRVACYFRAGADDAIYLLFTTSIRIVERTDPEVMELWGKKAVPFAVIKQQVQQQGGGDRQANKNNAAAAASSAGGDGQGGGASAVNISVGGGNAPAATGGASAGGANASGPGGGNGVLTAPPHLYQTAMDVQPLSLMPTATRTSDAALLEKLTTVPTHQTNMYLLQLSRKKAGGPTGKVRPVSKRLLSPFFTPGMEESDIPEDLCGFAAIRQNRLQKMDDQSRAIAAQNAELAQKLAELQRSAAELCASQDIGRLAKEFASEQALALEMSVPRGSGSPLESASQDSPLGHSNRRGSSNSPPRQRESSRAFGTAASAAAGASTGGSGGMTSADSFSRPSPLVRVVPSVVTHRRRTSRQSNNSSSPNLPPPLVVAASALLMAKMVVASCTAARAAALRPIGETAARLSDVFYPLADVIAEYRKHLVGPGGAQPTNSLISIPRAARCYGEDLADTLQMDHRTGEIRVVMPLDLFRQCRRVMGPHWGALRLTPVDLRSSTDVEDSVPSDVSPGKEAGDRDALGQQQQRQHGHAGAAAVTCVLSRPFQAASSFTFSPGKLEQCAAADADLRTQQGRLVAARVVTPQHRLLLDAVCAHRYHETRTMKNHCTSFSQIGTFNSRVQDSTDHAFPMGDGASAARKSLLHNLRAAAAAGGGIDLGGGRSPRPTPRRMSLLPGTTAAAANRGASPRQSPRVAALPAGGGGTTTGSRTTSPSGTPLQPPPPTSGRRRSGSTTPPASNTPTMRPPAIDGDAISSPSRTPVSEPLPQQFTLTPPEAPLSGPLEETMQPSPVPLKSPRVHGSASHMEEKSPSNDPTSAAPLAIIPPHAAENNGVGSNSKAEPSVAFQMASVSPALGDSSVIAKGPTEAFVEPEASFLSPVKPGAAVPQDDTPAWL